MSIALFGSSGFLGRELKKMFSEQKKVCYGISRSAGDHTDFQLDITKKEQFNDLDLQPGSAIICAAKLPEPYSSESLEKYYDVNVMGIWNILEWALDAGVQKVIYCSSLSVISNEEYKNGPVTEDSCTYDTGPHFQYTSSKLAGEILCKSFCKHNGLSCSVLRISAIYGPGMPWKGVLCSFVDKVMEGSIVEISNPRFNADFIHVRDVARCIYHILEKDHEGILNVASGRPVDLEQLLEYVKEESGVGDTKVIMGQDSEFPLKQVSVDKMMDILAPYELISLKEGIAELIETKK